MGHLTHHGVARCPLAPAATTPLIGLKNPARQERTIPLEALAGDDEPELIEAAEGGQVSAGEARTSGSVRHVEVFRMDSVRTSILGRPRPLPEHRRADRLYTLIWEEPDMDSACHSQMNS
jgi:hypothetical protein